jgi:hypothetical protein
MHRNAADGEESQSKQDVQDAEPFMIDGGQPPEDLVQAAGAVQPHSPITSLIGEL